jgi:hypothetical protein
MLYKEKSGNPDFGAYFPNANLVESKKMKGNDLNFSAVRYSSIWQI